MPTRSTKSANVEQDYGVRLLGPRSRTTSTKRRSLLQLGTILMPDSLLSSDVQIAARKFHPLIILPNPMQTISIKGKSYVTVNERLKYFRENFKGYAIITELVEVNDRTALIRAVVKNDKGEIVATGTSFERADNKKSMVNSTSHVENCETSAWGRALGNFGIGIDTSVASADEIKRVDDKVAYTDEASEEERQEIEQLITETGTDKVKLLAFFGVRFDPDNNRTFLTHELAKKMIVSLKAKLSKQLDAASQS